MAHKGAAANTYDISLEAQTNLLNTCSNFRDEIPQPKFSKNELVDIHLNNISLLQESMILGEPKPIILPTAYAPSIASLNDLRRVFTVFTFDTNND